MKYTNCAIVVAIAIFLQACATSPSAQDSKQIAQTTKVSGWAVIDPGFGNKNFKWERTDWWTYRYYPDVYWVRLKKAAAGYAISEVALAPIARNDHSEEILVANVREKQVFPAYMNRGTVRIIEPYETVTSYVVSKQYCDWRDTRENSPYTVCNSAFATQGGSFLGSSGANTYSPELLASLFDDQGLSTLVSAAAEKRRLAKLEADRTANEKRELTEKTNREVEARVAMANREAASRAADAIRVAEQSSVKALSKLPRGYKDVCEYSNPTLPFTFVTKYSEEITCINFGKVASLGSLRQAGFIVTNLIERNPSAPRSTRYNVEKNQ